MISNAKGMARGILDIGTTTPACKKAITQKYTVTDLAFIGTEKAFDSKVLNLILNEIKEIENDRSNVRVIHNLYRNQQVKIRHGNLELIAKVKKGTRRVFIMPFYLILLSNIKFNRCIKKKNS